MRLLLLSTVFSLSLQAAAQAAAPQPTTLAPVIAATPGVAAAQSTPHHPKLVEPELHVEKGGKARPHVALTLDACSGQTDLRILSVLVEENIPATIFVTARWLKHNPQALALMKTRPDLFELENHGFNHVPAVDFPMAIYGIAAAGSVAAVNSEVDGGAQAMIADGLARPHWFRGATARYSPTAIADIEARGYRIAGYSLNGDDGSLLGAGAAERRIAAARDGDVIIAHVNQPTHAAGEGVARGLRALKARGAVFVRLDADRPLPAAAAAVGN
ncbi:MAG: polysaccharide deacetylase family protein [Allorhizobium sp.]